MQEHWLTPDKLFLLNEVHPEFSGCGVSAMVNRLVSDFIVDLMGCRFALA